MLCIALVATYEALSYNLWNTYEMIYCSSFQLVDHMGQIDQPWVSNSLV